MVAVDSTAAAPVRHCRTLADLGDEGLRAVLRRSAELKALRGSPDHPRSLAGKTVAILLEKASTRTRLSFEVAAFELGGLPITLLARDTQLGRGEPLDDTARMFGGYVHAVVFRTHGHFRIETLAAASRVPVINGLSDQHHPCQLLADLLTMHEALGRVEGLRVAWIGDGNNMANSWIQAASLLDFELILACPAGHQPLPELIEAAPPGRVRLVESPDDAVRDADVVTTDVWASMGQEEEARDRRRVFRDYCVDGRRMALAAPRAIFLHCLPAHRGEEVAAEVIDGPRSWVWAEAENRLHAQKALLEFLIG